MLNEYFPNTLPQYNTSRSWIDYIKNLQIDVREISEGVTILDVGGSGKPSFDSVSNYFPKGTKIISIDPAYIIDGESAYNIDGYNDWQLSILSSNSDPDLIRKIGVVQSIPLDDRSIDIIWSNIAIPLYIDDDDLEIMWSELFRVIKPGGQIRLFPINQERQDKFIKQMREKNFFVEIFEQEKAPTEELKYGIRIDIPIDGYNQ